jgi:dTDP-4-dehydrorhamnose reductase
VMSTNAIIIRTSWLYSEYGNNFVKTMLVLGKERDELNIVSDQIGSPTYATDLANAILEIIKKFFVKDLEQATQIYHYSNKGEISWYEFTKEIFKIAKRDCKVNSITTQQYLAPAKRPIKTIMCSDKIVKVFGLVVFDWVESLQYCIKNIERK